MSESSYEQVFDGDWVDADLVQLACCDCGLVHTIKFRLKNAKLQYRMVRNNRATAALRRCHKFERH